MLSINTNLSSLIVQGNLQKSTDKLNLAIERMTTGYKINHASDNAANYSIATNMDTKIGAYMVAEDNASMGLDMLMTAENSLSLIGDKLARLRTLAVQSSNGTYGSESQKAINSEANALIDEMQRLHSTTEYNGQKLMGEEGLSKNNAIKMSKTNFTRRDTTSLKPLGEIEDSSVALADGTYSISTAQELAQLAEMTNAGLISEGDEFVLASDIDLSDYKTGEGWTPIGTGANKFAGTFDGNGHKIINLYINRPSADIQGLFGDSTGKLENINIINAEITGNGALGILVGVQRGNSISNCITSGAINGALYSIGGIAGQFYGEMKNCCAEVKITPLTDDVSRVGGLIGGTSGGITKIDSCYAVSEIVGSNSLGGLIGNCGPFTIDIEISNCFAKTDITTNNTQTYSGSFVGGFVGILYCDSKITNCTASGSISGGVEANKHTCIGGFAGGIPNDASEVNSSFDSCHSSVDIFLEEDAGIENIGGFIGQIDAVNQLTVQNCYSTGSLNITAPDSSNIGGFVGLITSTNMNAVLNIQNSYSTGSMQISSPYINNVGGFAGWISQCTANISNSYTLSDMYLENGIDYFDDVAGFIGDVSSVMTIDNCYNKNKINANLDPSVTNNIAGFVADIEDASSALSIKNSYMLADKESDIASIWGGRSVDTTFSIENSYCNRDFAESGIALFVDSSLNPINNESELSQVKTCATDSPFKHYFNQSTDLQVGIHGGASSTISVDMTCSLDYMNVLRNIGLQEDDYLSKIDKLMESISAKQTQIGAGSNRLMSVLEEISVQYDNLVSSRSTIKDADMAEVSATYIQQQILQEASATLLATANQTPALALQLL